MEASAAIMIALRFSRSATMPPKGESSPVGSMEEIIITESQSADPVLSVTYQTRA